MVDWKRAVVLSVTCVLLRASSLLAQTPAPMPPPPPPPHEGTAEFSFVGTSGNASTSAFGLGGEFIARPAPWVFRAKAIYIRNESDEILRAESFSGLFRATRPLNDRLSAFGEYGFLHDRFAGTESRNVVDGGVTYALVRPLPHQLEVDAAIGYAHENRVAGEALSSAQFLTGARYKFVVSQTAEITDELTYSLALDNSSDWRTSNIAAITVKVTTILSLKLSNLVRYVNAPVPGFETTDSTTSFALVAKF